MALSLPCELGNFLGSSCSFGRQFLAITAETIQHQMLKTVRKFESLCVKYSRETGTVNEIAIDVHQAITDDQDMNGHEAEDLPVVDVHDAEGLSVNVLIVGLFL